MKKYLLLFAFLSCTKSSPKFSEEVSISVVNECFCKIVFEKEDEQISNQIFDCEYVRELHINLPEGKYKVYADNLLGRKKEIDFVKGKTSQSLTIIF